MHRPVKQTIGAGGYALVAVLWMTAAMTLLVSTLVHEARSEIRAVTARRDLARAEAGGDAAIQLAARAIAADPASFGLQRALDVGFDGQRMRVQVTPVNGLIPLNAAPEPLLAALFAYGAGLDPDSARRMAQRVIDWRDPDDAALPGGAENPDYEAAGSPFRTRGGPFEAPEDLLQVLGMTLDTYDKIKDLVTVDSGAARCNPLAAPLEVLLVLAGGDAATAQRISAARDAGNTLVDTTSLMQEFIDQSTSSRFRVRAFMPVEGLPQVYVRTQVLEVAPAQAGQPVPWMSLRVERATGFVPDASFASR